MTTTDKRTKVFFDTEFTGLHQHTTLISIGMVAETGPTFYAEFGDFDHLYGDKWIDENVINRLKFHEKKGKGWCNCGTQNSTFSNATTEAYGNREFVAACIEAWIVGFGPVEIWSDCLSYDWVLFNQLWGHAFNLPPNIYYIPFDICTMFKLAGVNPDIGREEYAGMLTAPEKHNALWDARVIKACYERLSKDG